MTDFTIRRERQLQRGDKFMVFIIGGNTTINRLSLRIMQRHWDIVIWGQVKYRLLLIQFIQDFQEGSANALRNFRGGNQLANFGRQLGKGGDTQHPHRAQSNFVVAMVPDRIKNWLRFARSCQEREERERFVRLMAIFASEAIHRLRNDAGLNAGLRNLSHRLLVSRFHYS